MVFRFIFIYSFLKDTLNMKQKMDTKKGSHVETLSYNDSYLNHPKNVLTSLST